MKRITQGILFLFFLCTSVAGQLIDPAIFVPERLGMATPPDVMTKKGFDIEDGFQYGNYTDGLFDIQASSSHLCSSGMALFKMLK